MMVLLEDNFMSHVKNRILVILLSLAVLLAVVMPVLADGAIAGG